MLSSSSIEHVGPAAVVNHFDFYHLGNHRHKLVTFQEMR
jgi:hypothetical protein